MDDIWQKAVDAMQGKISKDYIYLYLSKNRNDVFNRIHRVETSKCINESTFDTTADDSSDDSNWSMAKTDCMLPPIHKAITILKSEWDTFKLHVLEYKHRKYEVLVIGWTDTVYDILWSYLKLPSLYSFKNAKINRNPGEIFLSIKAIVQNVNRKFIFIVKTNRLKKDRPYMFPLSILME